MINLKIDPEFQSQIPPLTDDEFKQLEENNMCKYHAVPNTQLKDRLYLHSILWEIEEMQSHYQIHQHLLLSQLHHGKKLPKLLFYLIHTLPYANTSSETK